MGWDLQPINPSKEAPRYRGQPQWGHYNVSGWQWLIGKLTDWGVSIEHFSSYNDGEEIPESKCVEVADAIERNLETLSAEDQEWLKSHIVLWRTCGWYRQY